MPHLGQASTYPLDLVSVSSRQNEKKHPVQTPQHAPGKHRIANIDLGPFEQNMAQDTGQLRYGYQQQKQRLRRQDCPSDGGVHQREGQAVQGHVSIVLMLQYEDIPVILEWVINQMAMSRSMLKRPWRALPVVEARRPWRVGQDRYIRLSVFSACLA